MNIVDLRKLRGHQPTGSGLDETNPPTCGSCLGCSLHPNEIDSFISGREDITYMYQTNPFIHSLLTHARVDKMTVADLLEHMLAMYHTSSKKQSNELLNIYLKHPKPIIGAGAQD